MEAKKQKTEKKPVTEHVPTKFGYSVYGEIAQKNSETVSSNEVVGDLGDPIIGISIEGFDGSVDVKRNMNKQLTMVEIEDPDGKLVGGIHVKGGTWVDGEHIDGKFVLGCHIPFDQIWLDLN